MQLALVQYNAGNLSSVVNALNRLGVEPLVTDDAEQLRAADKVIFPGQGHAGTAMAYLRQRGLDAVLRSLHQPFLGICLGQQLMCLHSEEEDTECLGLIPLQVKRFPPDEKVPHMGWNTLTDLKGPLYTGVPEGSHVYFVHSYYAEHHPDYTAATCHYMLPFSASVQYQNYYAVQYHPEKSGPLGSRILENFLRL
ncbi:MAG: imidazole glycerol phosphate synthase subunit HisH [Bacteroidetes bacterium]|jgi:glutamine amidotransferase|nr:imidazole glycerol phosphate synthase subunit HisH [Bacteroidota bacterium]